MKKAIIENIQNFVKNYQKNPNITTQWGIPIVKFASSSDPLFSQLSSVAKPDPRCSARTFLPEAKSVIAFFLPFKKSISRSQYKCVNIALMNGGTHILKPTRLYDNLIFICRNGLTPKLINPS